MSSPWQGKHGPLLIAEIGGNHEGNFNYACRLTELALETDVDYVKFQLYTGAGLVNPLQAPDRHAHFKRFELKPEEHRHLAGLCRRAGIGYMASVWDLSFLDWMDEYLTIYKIGSGDLTAYPILRALAGRGKPMLLSTGLATLEEVLDAVNYLRSLDPRFAAPDRLALLQCTTAYPNEPRFANLAAMQTLRRATGLPVGYSHHTEGLEALCVAAAMGAEILEFHFTDTREGKTFRDHKISLTPAEVGTLKECLAAIRTMQGDGLKRPQECEMEGRRSFRRAVYPARDLPRGHRLTADDLVCLRPNDGIDAREFDRVVGRRARRPLAAWRPMSWEDLEA